MISSQEPRDFTFSISSGVKYFPAPGPHSVRSVAVIAERRVAAVAILLFASLIPLLLFLKPLFQRLHDLFPVTERFHLLHFLGRQIFFRHSLQPFQRNFGLLDAIACFQSLEDLGKDLIEPIERSEEHTYELQSLMRS